MHTYLVIKWGNESLLQICFRQVFKISASSIPLAKLFITLHHILVPIQISYT